MSLRNVPAYFYLLISRCHIPSNGTGFLLMCLALPIVCLSFLMASGKAMMMGRKDRGKRNESAKYEPFLSGDLDFLSVSWFSSKAAGCRFNHTRLILALLTPCVLGARNAEASCIGGFPFEGDCGSNNYNNECSIGDTNDSLSCLW